VTFLQHCTRTSDPLTKLYELIICTGMRKGEALALHWADVDLDDQLLFVRYTLSNINNTTPVFTTPKTKSSHTWIGLSPRSVRALRRQAERQRALRLAAGPGYQDQDLVFTRRNGQPLRHEYVLRHLRQLTTDAGLPRIRVHDLRLRRHHHAVLAGAAGHGVQDDAALHPLDHHRGLRAPAPSRRPAGRRGHRHRPQRRRERHGRGLTTTRRPP